MSTGKIGELKKAISQALDNIKEQLDIIDDTLLEHDAVLNDDTHEWIGYHIMDINGARAGIETVLDKL